MGIVEPVGRRRRTGAFLILASLAVSARASDTGYRAEIEKWRAKREASLKADGGWLSVAGLFWLEEGTHRLGSEPGSDFVLPPSAPAQVGEVVFHEGRTRIHLAPGVAGSVRGTPVTETELRADSAGGENDVLSLGRITLQVIERGGRFGLRMKDMDSPARREFEGLRWYPVRESYRVVARFVPHTKPRAIPITNILGQTSELPSPGRAEFTLQGRQLSLEPVLEEPDAKELFFIFRDETSAKETYGAGRYVYTEMPKDGRLVLDFNKAYSPPCAFTAYATCPLPPRQNRLPVRIEAGELGPSVHPAR